MFKLETHCHTSEVSGCSRLPAVQLVTQLKRAEDQLAKEKPRKKERVKEAAREDR